MATAIAGPSMATLIGLGLCLLGAHEIRAAAPIKVPMTADRWETTGNAEYVKYKDLDALHLKGGVAVVKDVTFRNGTIEFDVDPVGTMGAGVGFRRRDGDTCEDFYLRPRPRRVLVQIVLGLLVTAGYVYVFAAARALLGVGDWGALRTTDLLAGALRGMFLWGCVVYWLIVGVWRAYHYSQRYLSSELRMERLERQFAEARLSALRMQLDPHFLFNALNTISSQRSS